MFEEVQQEVSAGSDRDPERMRTNAYRDVRRAIEIHPPSAAADATERCRN